MCTTYKAINLELLIVNYSLIFCFSVSENRLGDVFCQELLLRHLLPKLAR